MNRLERLLNLVAALLDAQRPLRRIEIGDRVPGYPTEPETFRRAFERDKEALRSMGIPLVIEEFDPDHPDAGEGYRIRRDQYQLKDPGLTPEELAALHLAASTVRLEGGSSTEAIWKLGGTPAPSADPLAFAALPGSEYLEVLFAAVGERRTVTFGYRERPRTADPYGLVFRNGFWYLSAWDRERDEERSFRLDRITTTPEAGPAGGFERRAERVAGQKPPWEMGEEDAVDAVVLVDASQAEFAVARAGTDSVAERRADGSVLLRLRVTNRDALRSFVLGLLDRAEIVEPPELRDDVVAWLAHMVSP